jgi:hypothetical protein
MVLSLVVSIVGCSEDDFETGTLHVSKAQNQSGRVISSADIKIYDADDGLVAEKAGKHELKEGTYTVKVTAEGYQTFEEEYTVSVNKETSVTPKLKLKSLIEDVKLENTQATVEVGADFVLPAIAIATMSDGSTKEVAVQWDKEVDTSQAGEYSFTGSVDETDQTVEFTLIVEEGTGSIDIGIDLEQPPTAPTNLSGEFKNKQVVLNWKQVDQDVAENDNFGGYLVYRSQSDYKLGKAIHSTLVADTTYTDSDVAAGKTYYYQVRAYGGQTGMLAGKFSTTLEVVID